MSLDYSGLTSLTVSLGAVTHSVQTNVEKAVEQSARRVKDAWNGKLYNEGHASRTGRSITYDVGAAHDLGLFGTVTGEARSSTIVAEIGPRTGSGKQAGIVRLLENGSVHNAPHGYGAAALDENAADFEQAVAFAVWAGEKEAGL